MENKKEVINLKEMEQESELIRRCIEAACRSKESVEKWRRQRRSLERLPSHLSQALLRNLLRRRLLFPSLLEVFKHSAEEIDLRGENYVDEEWMAYLGAFRYLRTLNLANCHRINNSAIWSLVGMTSLKELDLSRCMKVSDAGVRHIISISTLDKLWISETGVTANGVALLSSLKDLSVLDLGGLPVTDTALNSLQVLTKLQYLDLWGSKISNKGAFVLQSFPKLSFLNLAWTNVTSFPNLPSLECLNMSNCAIDSILEGGGDKSPFLKLVFSGATFASEAEAFLHIKTSSLSYLDVSKSSLDQFGFLADMKMLEHLDLNSSTFGDGSVEMIVCIGSGLKNLNLSRTKVSSVGIGILAGQVPKLEILSLSQTSIDDVALSYIGLMPSLKVVDLSNTNIKGFILQPGNDSHKDSTLTVLQSLNYLESLNLEHTQVRDPDLYPLSSCKELSHLSLRCVSLTDATLHHLSSLPKLTTLQVRDAVLTTSGLDAFSPPKTLRLLDLMGCWLLTEDAISLFLKKHPQVEIRHEVIQNLSAEQQIISSSPSSSQQFSKISRWNKKQEKSPMPEFLVDQRLKYSKEELLALQFSPLSLIYPHKSASVSPNLQ
ncbi:AMP-dependent synthetase and ligase family protein isoform 1 [Hibiscus syriacus]|uniref:AMP-dependent synthetase and ligase family protein isoform 1 n=1 Tax=Hibiscus syriacus TaxID=106335 RepID=A0A6A2XNG2_HIBSY|nr:receptor-like protein 53 [Hibiscus syriacus]KAE8677961.1 AMP-dependent synthetase and ligase family protein isoform 1 [Hibiscus syriacus]